MEDFMKRFALFGILIVLLVLINCVSTPQGPSPFEGRWAVDSIEEPGPRVQNMRIFPHTILISGDRFTLSITGENPDGSRGTPAIIIHTEKFTYNATEIIVGRGKDARIFNYILKPENLTTIDASYGKIIWAREN